MLNRTFWNFVSGFVLILIVSFSLLTVFGVYKESKEHVAAHFTALRGALDEE